MFDKIISLENLFDAWTEFKKEKSNKNDVTEFEVNLEDHVFALHEDLKNGIYKHGGYFSFFVHDWSSRKTKGIHAAVRRLQDLALRLSHNYTRTLWILKLDVTKFFASIDHKILLSILSKRTGDGRVINLFQEIVGSFNPGLPLGNLTYQLFANVYLNELDQFIKHDLKIKGYVRYADDFVLMHENRELLIDCRWKIEHFLQERLLLKIHPKKLILKTYASGIDFLGYVSFPHHRVIRTKTKRRMFRRINKKNLPSYSGILKHCRSRNLSKELVKVVKESS